MLMDWNPRTPPPPSLWDWDPQPDWPLPGAPPLPQEPPLGLRLGKRTYFEDTTPSSASVSAAAAAKRTRASSVQMFRCQVEGCGADLTASKDYHRKHRVCELHSKSPRVLVAGQERRFCQQCSRFHDLAAFDEKKKSCRKRLSDHNARRRKPQPGTISFGSPASAFYDNRQQMNLLVNRASLGPIGQSASSTWEGSFDFKLSDIKGSWVKSPKGDGEGHRLLSGSELTNAFSTLRHNLGTIIPFKGTPAEVLNQGPGASTVASSLNRAPDLRRAFSLLSTDSWVTTEHEPTTASSAEPVLTNQSSATHHATHTMNSASGCWQDEQPLTQPSRMTHFSIPSNASQFQEFQLLKSSYETTFFDSTEIQ